MATNIKIRVRVNEWWGKYKYHILEGKGNFDSWDSYFLRLNRDHAVAKYATSKPSRWESNPDL